jgi:hypothetical protein
MVKKNLPSFFTRRCVTREFNDKLKTFRETYLDKIKDPTAELTKEEMNRLINILMELKVDGVTPNKLRKKLKSDHFEDLRRHTITLAHGPSDWIAPELRERGFEIIHASYWVVDELEKKFNEPKKSWFCCC